MSRPVGPLPAAAEPPTIPQDFPWPQEMGVKTKKQHSAEKQVGGVFYCSFSAGATLVVGAHTAQTWNARRQGHLGSSPGSGIASPHPPPCKLTNPNADLQLLVTPALVALAPS